MKKLIGLIICIVVFSSCARIVTPTGGEKDYVPPKVRKSFPENNSTNFKSKEVRIDFDEYITLENVSQKLIVSPPLKNKPTVTSKLKSLYIKDLDSLQDNTTYIFDFGDAIRDFNEGNPISHFVFAVSTGEDIDTMTYYGRVLNSYTLKAEKAKYVVLYSSSDKEVQTTTLPTYITRCDSLGRFSFYNIKKGEYSLLAYDDNNNNLIYDLATEGIGFSQNNIIARQENDTTFKGDTVFFSSAKDTILKLNEAKFVAEKEISLSLSMPLTDSFQIEFINPILQENEYIINKFQTDSSASVSIYLLTEKDVDTLEFNIREINNFKENQKLVFQRKKVKKEVKKKFSFTLANTKLPYYDTLALNMPFPLKKDFVLQATVVKDSDTVTINFTQDEKNAKRLVSDYVLQEDSKYFIIIDSSLVVNDRGETNDSLAVAFSTDKKDDYSVFILALIDTNNSNKQIILTLLDEKNNRVGKDIVCKANQNKIVFEHLKEGNYKLRAITDENNNNKWDGNNFILHKQAEKVQYFPQTINIRKGWEREEEWQISL